MISTTDYIFVASLTTQKSFITWAAKEPHERRSRQPRREDGGARRGTGQKEEARALQDGLPLCPEHGSGKKTLKQQFSSLVLIRVVLSLVACTINIF
jgi:hypothetical protein